MLESADWKVQKDMLSLGFTEGLCTAEEKCE